ncbi:hypothetical protein PYJP_00930 [Pyrofollis japonicus]|uniref:hypothetical protein n=1 Tax=Pyrofollis japonicus TaxID=3060460 RepID=UPI00295ABBB4|nr:hypothetical protein [Pyrofollis japonicus]BEP16741.1 hypothetical protein PYJP_00930 [Pyrofollis japonicus]
MENKVKNILVLSIVVVAAFAIMHSVLASDEAQVIINNWLKGKPKMLVKLEIDLPSINADKCIVHVRRFPSIYNPTKDGYTEPIYTGTHKPGSRVIVSKILNAYVTKYTLDKKTNELRVGYYEPQEFLVLVNCLKNGKQVYKWGKIVEVYPKSIIYTKKIAVQANQLLMNQRQSHKFNKTTHIRAISRGGLNPSITDSASTDPFKCSIVIQEEGTDYKKGYCLTWVKGPYLYSIEGLTTKFCLDSRPPKSAVYLEAFEDLDAGIFLRPESDVEWSSAGKKLVPSQIEISQHCPSLTGNHKEEIYFWTEYIYEWSVYYCDSFSGICYEYWLLYPYMIRGIAKASDLGITPYPEDYVPPSNLPPYANPGYYVDKIYFGQYGAYQSDVSLSGITVTVTYSNVWSASLTIHFYKAGRDDNQYTTPYVYVEYTRFFYWWFKDNDPMTYEVLFSPG